MEERKKPFPIPDINSAPFWKAAQEHKLKLPKCQKCGHIAFPPRPGCPRCFGTMEWTEMSGRGTVYSYSIMHDTFIRGFDPPFLTAPSPPLWRLPRHGVSWIEARGRQLVWPLPSSALKL